MSSGNVYERLLKQIAAVLKMVVDGKRDPERVSRMLQAIIDGRSREELLDGWKNFYQKFFGIDLDLSQVRIPERRQGFNRLIVVAKGLTPNQVFETCQEHFPCLRYTEDLDEITKGRNDREPDQTYAIWVRDRQEADKELKNFSANVLKEQGISGITLTERLLLELNYWSETGQHLDLRNWTLCSGSCDYEGDVPDVHWDWRLEVGWSSSQEASPRLRARAVVS